MLSHINIKNFAIVDRLELELNDQLSVMTGETGAGKSILIDALGLVLGDRADTGFIRHGSEKSEITASFTLNNNDVATAWLNDNDLEPDSSNDSSNESECIIRRTVNKDGRSRAYINGRTIPVSSLRQLGELLVDIHGQHEHQSLMRPGEQRLTLDQFAKHKPQLEKLASLFQQWRDRDAELQTLITNKQNRDEKLALLQYQLQEFDALALEENETDNLDTEHKRLSNANKLVDSSEKIIYSLDEDEDNSILGKLNQLNSEIDQLNEIDNQLSTVSELLNQSCILISESVSELRQYSESLEIDPQRLQWVDQRITVIQDLARKHHVKPKQLLELHQQLAAELEEILDADTKLEDISNEVAKLKKHYIKSATELSASRSKAAKKLAKQITANMQTLGMQGGRFEINVEQLDEDNHKTHGMDRITFQVSANQGQPLKPMTKVASGGELSRISLAIQIITAKDSSIPTLIFDEVDTGVGGAVAEMVGQMLRKLGKERQIICVTHLPQVASLAHNHFCVNKTTKNKNTLTEINSLDDAERIDEIARMLGGIEMTKQTLSHAKEMINRASQF